MTLRSLMDNKYSQDFRLSASPSLLFLASLLLVLMLAAVCAPIALADEKPATTKSVSTSNPASQCDWINCFGDLDAMERPHHDLLPTVADDRAFNENEFLPAPPTANPSNTLSAIFKPERWRTNKAVIASSIFEAAWLTADGITTAGQRRGAIEVGSVWAYGRNPTPGRTAAMIAAEFVGVEASSYLLHKMKAPKWVYIAPMLISGSVHASGAIPNIRNGQ